MHEAWGWDQMRKVIYQNANNTFAHYAVKWIGPSHVCLGLGTVRARTIRYWTIRPRIARCRRPLGLGVRLMWTGWRVGKKPDFFVDGING